MSESKIEWTDVTWNPLAGCTYVSEGCRFCYAATMTRRLEAMGQADYAGLTTSKHFNGTIRLRPDKLAKPLKWRKPRRVFVNSMCDLFHKDVPDEFIAAVFGIMAACPLHTFQILTKRADRLASWSLAVQAEGGIGRYIRDNEDRRKVFRSVFGKVQKTAVFYGKTERADDDPWMLVMNAAACNYGKAPLTNVWLGVSVENQAAADERIPHLLRTPAAVRFLSCEPLLEEVCIADGLDVWNGDQHVDWVIPGCESRGSKAGRFADGYEAAARSIVQQCQTAGVAVLHKQMPINGRVSHDPAEWPEDLRIREYPTPAACRGA